MKRVPGRATSLASVGLLLGLSVLVAALGATPGTGSGGTRSGSALAAQTLVHRRTGAHIQGATGPSNHKTTLGDTVSQTFRCLYPEGSGGQALAASPS